MHWFQVSVQFPHGTTRSAMVTAFDAPSAAVKAIVTRKLPIEVLNGPNGPVDVYWVPELGKEPQFTAGALAWKQGNFRHVLPCSVDPCGDNTPIASSLD